MLFRALQYLAVMLLMATTSVLAAQPGGPPPGAQLAQELGLNASQAARLTAVLDAERAAMDTLRAERQRILGATREQVAGFLTADQLRRFDEARESGPPMRQRQPRDAQKQAPERKPS
ncbi:MAG: hypothetical protein JNM76_10540 [Betaproteobacteria bacterium]|nr:hypothetical protein [Betaproteobacteria bacterium]